MAEAVAAFALAGNVVQFLEVGGKLVKKSWDIYNSKGNALKDLEDLQVLTLELQNTLGTLRPPMSSATMSTDVVDASPITNLSQACFLLAQELLGALEKIGVRGNGDRKKALLTAFKAMWKSSEIADLQRRIDMFRQQLAIGLVVSLRETHTKSLKQQENIFNEIKLLRAQVTSLDISAGPVMQTEDNLPGDVILDYLSSFLVHEDSAEIGRLKLDMAATVIRPQADSNSEQSLLGRSQAYILPKSREEMLRSRFIESLRYGEMEYRRAQISDAHQATFRWIFDSSNASHMFTDWLESDSTLYWITGKAGSGKSTLIKFIDQYERQSDGGSRCGNHLALWAGDMALITASFYFWASGTSMENSQKGLFTTLLFQIFSLRPDIIPDALPEDWEWECLFGRSSEMPQWNEADLRRLFLHTISVLTTLRDTKVCLFIDGLDEFDGKSWELIKLIRRLKELPNLKLCVSSRPWLVFEDEFKQQPSLMLQDVSGPDIKRFITSKFDRDDGFRRLQLRDPQYASTFMENIADKSSGVFLWVEIVVTSLLAGLSQDDRISDLQRRLDALPADLQKLYVAILDQLDPYYFQHASQYFMLALESRLPPDGLAFFYADEESPETALRMPVASLSEDENALRISTLRRRLNSRCKGLLEIGPGNRVQYLHRTVEDYLDGPDVRGRLQGAAGDFDSYLRYCCGYLSWLKTLTPQSAYAEHCVEQCLESAAKVTKDDGLIVRLVDCLRETIPLITTPKQAQKIYNAVPDQSRFRHWALAPRPRHSNFLSLVTRYGVVAYVSARIRRPDLPRVENNSLTRAQPRRVANFMRSLFANKTSVNFQDPRIEASSLLIDAIFAYPPKVEIYRAIFDAGGQHSLQLGDETPWVAFLLVMVEAANYSDGKDTWTPWASILKLFVSNGAKLNKKTVQLALGRFSVSHHGFSVDRAQCALEFIKNGQDARGLKELRHCLGH